MTAKTISLGVLTDTSGVFAGLGGPLVEGNQLFWKLQNAKGGVCGRQVELVVKDHGYDPQKGVSLYREIEPKVLAIQQLLGSPVAAALLPSIQKDGILTALAAWPSQLTANPQHPRERRDLRHRGDQRRRPSRRERDAEQGRQARPRLLRGRVRRERAAGLQVRDRRSRAWRSSSRRSRPPTPTSTAQVAALKRDGVKAILISAGPKQTASLAGVAAASGLDVPIVGNAPGFDPGAARDARRAGAREEPDDGRRHRAVRGRAPGAAAVSAAYEQNFPKGTPKYSVDAGYAQSQLMFEVLQRACAAKDLSRDGVVKALRGMDGVDTGGLVAGTLELLQARRPAVAVGLPVEGRREGAGRAERPRRRASSRPTRRPTRSRSRKPLESRPPMRLVSEAVSPMEELVQVLRSRQDELVDEGVRRIRTDIPAYARISDPAFVVDVRRHVAAHHEVIVRSLAARPAARARRDVVHAPDRRPPRRADPADVVHARLPDLPRGDLGGRAGRPRSTGRRRTPRSSASGSSCATSTSRRPRRPRSTSRASGCSRRTARACGAT